MNKKQQLKELKNKIASLPIFGKKCFFCGCRKSRKGFTFHHRWYLKEGDVISSDPKYKPRNDSNNLQYYLDLEPLIEKCPVRFRYLCNTCHHSYSMIFRYSDEKLKMFKSEQKSTEKDRIKYS